MRYVLMVVGFIVVVVAVVAIIGWSLPVKHQATVERTFRASPAALFGLITDVASFPSWRSELTGVETLPEESGHRRWIEKSKSGPPITYVAEREIPGRLLVGRIANTNLAFGGTWTYTLEPKGDGVTALRITEDGEVYNPIFRFVSRYVMGHDATMKQYLAAVGKRLPPADETVSPR
jgi:hypothetical protein